jgi:hypothetical protein
VGCAVPLRLYQLVQSVITFSAGTVYPTPVIGKKHFSLGISAWGCSLYTFLHGCHPFNITPKYIKPQVLFFFTLTPLVKPHGLYRSKITLLLCSFVLLSLEIAFNVISFCLTAWQ